MKIKVKMELFNKCLYEIGVDDTRLVDLIIETDHIVAINPSIVNGEVSDNITHLYMVSGEEFQVKEKMEFFERLLVS